MGTSPSDSHSRGSGDVRKSDETEPALTNTSNEGPSLAEDLLLLLFQPRSGVIAGENTLFYALAGAVLADLAMGGQVTTTSDKPTMARIRAVANAAPDDPLLRATWDYVEHKARHVQTVLAATGPTLRQPVLRRLLERGDLQEREHRALGMFPTTKLVEGDTGRRAALLASVREVLVEGREPEPRVAALAALVYGSGTLPQFDPEIPWNSAVVTRAQELKRGNWGAGAAAQAVARTIAAVVANSVVASTTVLPRG